MPGLESLVAAGGGTITSIVLVCLKLKPIVLMKTLLLNDTIKIEKL
jgi:hypothetical protein